jgi:hypothetical protein
MHIIVLYECERPSAYFNNPHRNAGFCKLLSLWLKGGVAPPPADM